MRHDQHAQTEAVRLPNRAQESTAIVGKGCFEAERNPGALQIVHARERRQADPCRTEPFGFEQCALESGAAITAIGVPRVLSAHASAPAGKSALGAAGFGRIAARDLRCSEQRAPTQKKLNVSSHSR